MIRNYSQKTSDMMDEEDMDLVLEALLTSRIDMHRSLDNYITAAEVTNHSEPAFVDYMMRKIARLDNLYERIFAIRYKIDIL